jgi:hypothetical protein
MPKASRATVEARIQEIVELRLGGAEYIDIVDPAGRNRDENGQPIEPWGVKRSQIFRYIQEADKRIAGYFDARAPSLLARHLLQRRRLYAHSMEMRDLKTALAILKDEALLEQLYQAAAPPTPPDDRPPLRPEDVTAVLSRQLRALETADLPAAERAKLITAAAGALLQAHGAVDVEKRLAELEAHADRVKKGRA